MLASGIGAAITDTIFNPLELLKVQRQLVARHERISAVAAEIYRNGGLWSLWTPGLHATWVRAFGVTGLRVGLYPTVRDALGGEGVAGKAAAGMATGAISAALANPIDMVRVRMHAQAGLPTRRYATTLAAALAIVREEGGAVALTRGLPATIARQMLLSGGQLASYDQSKQELKNRGVAEGPLLHVCCGLISGFVAQAACMPADVLKTKLLSGAHGTSVSSCLVATIRTEGPMGLYRGFLPAVSRQCPVILVQMPMIEAIRKTAGLGNI